MVICKVNGYKLDTGYVFMKFGHIPRQLIISRYLNHWVGVHAIRAQGLLKNAYFSEAFISAHELV